jgi:uncharacterized Zn-binding protein involved in type VI secretion
MPPAARITDMHVCPMVTGVVPHVGGPILPPCEPTVLIGGLPATRITDMATCVGPPDVIVKGSPTVLIGSLLAARIGDLTAHGGVIILGCPTVIIGEAGAPSPSAPGLPLGAVPGPMGARLPNTELTAPGFPPLPAEDAGNFMDAKPVVLPKGTKLYRIIDDGSNPAGSYWALEKPASESAWRSRYAVKEKWNKDGKFVEYTVEDDAGIRSWVGPASSQQAAPGAIHPGGGAQVWVPKGTTSPGPAQSTGWSGT